MQAAEPPGKNVLPDTSNQHQNSNPATEVPRMVIDFDLLRKVAAQNFRDLGGHPAIDGRRVKRAMVYRSSHLAEVPERHPLRELSLRTLVTLQSRVEVRHLGAPHDSVLSTVRWEHIPMGDEWFDRASDAADILREPDKLHLGLVTMFRGNWRRFFSLLAQGDVYPLLFHCSAGRDRTGVGAAMLLELLGVSRERIVGDFLASNDTFPTAPLKPAQLDPVFASIDDAGGIRGFMRDVIGIGESEMEAIRQDLLES